MQGIEALLIDLDGTVYQGRELIPGARPAIDRLREAGVPILFTTNTSRMSRADIVSMLAAKNLAVQASEVFSAPIAAARWLRSEGMRRVQLLVASSTRADFEDFEITDDAPDAVLVGDLGSGFTFERLNGAFRSLRSGARLIAIHRNRFWLPEEGPTLDAGPFVAALEYASRVEAILVGKPAPAFFEAASSLLGVPHERLAVVGDDPETDIRGGRAAGLHTIQVRTGKFDEALQVEFAPGEGPDRIVDSLADVPSLFA